MPTTTLPLLKNILDAGGNAERFHDWLSEQSIAFHNRPWMFAVPGRPASIVLSSPELFRDVLVTQDKVFLRGPVGQAISYDIFGNGMVVADGDSWYFHRKTASRLFSMQMMKGGLEATTRAHLGVFLDVLDVYVQRGQAFSMKKELSHFAMDVIAKIGFGLELDTLKNSVDREDDHEFLLAFNEASVAFGEKLLMDNTRIMHDFIDNVIVESMTKKAQLAAEGKPEVARDVVALFLEKRLAQTEDRYLTAATSW
ncbi:unnamed protein product [Hyaloperonospora brassicae]|nr:unnamed protein product [Hyaloperonospora brassicae]